MSGRHADAEASARRLLALDSTVAVGWFTLALCLQPQGRMLEALDAATRAAGLAPGEEGYAGLKAQIENGIGAADKARHTLETALAGIRCPRAALRTRGRARATARGLPAAAAAYEQVLQHRSRSRRALSQLTFLRSRLADWRDREQLVQRYREGVRAAMPALSPFALLSLPSTRAEQRKCAETWSAAMASAEPMSRRRVLSAGRLRIGYLSADFHSHATSFLAAGLFERHDRARFEIVAYSTGPDDRSPMRARDRARVRPLRRLARSRSVGHRRRHPRATPSTFSSISRATRRTRRRSCWRGGRRRSRSTIWVTRGRSAPRSSTT